METLISHPSNSFPFHISSSLPFKSSQTRLSTKFSVSVKPPPPDFDHRSEFLQETRTEVSRLHPELLGLVENGSLILVKRSRLCRRRDDDEFVEPEMIWIVGVDHLLESSGRDVERVVMSVRPQSVVVELCRSRAGIMYSESSDDDEAVMLKSSMFSLTGEKFFAALSRSLSLGGQSALALRLLFAAFSSKISSSTGKTFGREFHAARVASEAIGAEIVLGDRPIEITLGRAWRALKLAEKLKLVKILIEGIASPSSEIDRITDEAVKQRDSPSSLYEELGSSFPSLVQPLMHERDVYLAWSLKRSKAVNKSKQVVGVIGKSHMKGVTYALVTDQGALRFRNLVGKEWDESRANKRFSSFTKNLVRDTVISIFIWALYEQLKAHW